MSFNFGAGTPMPSGTSGFSFGSAAVKPVSTATGFGTASTAPGFGFGSLGSTTAPVNKPGIGTGGFGFGPSATSTAATSSAFNFGQLGATTATTASSLGLFGKPTLSTGTSSIFGTGTGFGATTSSTGGFGTGFSLGSTGTTTGLGFGSGLGTQQALQLQQLQQQQRQQQQTPSNNLMNTCNAVSAPVVYGDERDMILAKWNQLQAFWGTGKGYYSQNGSVNFTPDSPFCRFKAVGYMCKPKGRNEDGLVALTLNRKESEVRSLQQQFVDSLFAIAGSKPTLSVCVEGVKSLSDEKTEVLIYFQERLPTGTSRRIPASDLYSFLGGATAKPQLEKLGVSDLRAETQLTPEQLRGYLEVPPRGYDARLWEQTKLDNPDPDNLFPIPMIGFTAVRDKSKTQEIQTKQHQTRLKLIGQEISDLQRSQDTIQAKTAEYKRKQQDLSRRVLKVMEAQEIYRKSGQAIQMEEEQLRIELEPLSAELNAPTGFRGRLNEMMSQLRMQHQASFQPEDRYEMDNLLQEEIKLHLKQQQEGIKHLMSIIKDDLEDLKLIESGLSNVIQHQQRY